MTFAVLNEVVDQKHGDEEYRDLESVEVEGHSVVAETAPADDYHEGKNEQSDLHT